MKLTIITAAATMLFFAACDITSSERTGESKAPNLHTKLDSISAKCDTIVVKLQAPLGGTKRTRTIGKADSAWADSQISKGYVKDLYGTACRLPDSDN